MAQGKTQMAVWNEGLSTKEKVDKAIKNLLKAEAEYQAIIERFKEETSNLEDNMNKAKKAPKYQIYFNKVYKDTLEKLGVQNADKKALDNDNSLDFLD